MAPDTLERSVPALKDPTLLRQHCYVDGAWVDADDGATITVANPATGAPIGTVPRAAAPPRRGARSRPPSAAWPAWRAKTAKERARSCASGST